MKKLSLTAAMVCAICFGGVPTFASDLAEAHRQFDAGNYMQAQALFENAAYSGDVDAQLFIANFHYYGMGEDVDKTKAAYFYDLAGQNGNVSAMMLLGIMLEKGDGIDQSLEGARSWYEKAAAAGNTQGQTLLDNLRAKNVTPAPIDTGNTKPDNYEPYAASTLPPGFSLYSAGPAEDFEDGQTAYFSNEYAKAYRIWLALANSGDLDAQNALGDMYSFGQHVTASNTEAVNWYRKAADAGHAKGQVNLGIMLEDGAGIPQSYTKAAGYYRLAMAQGDDEARAYLGELYETGKGVPKDITRARQLYEQAAKNGETYAVDRLAEMDGPSAPAEKEIKPRKPLNTYPADLPDTARLNINAVKGYGSECVARNGFYKKNTALLGPDFMYELTIDCAANIAQLSLIENAHSRHFEGRSSNQILDWTKLKISYLQAYQVMSENYLMALNHGFAAEDNLRSNPLACNMKRQERILIAGFGETLDPGGEMEEEAAAFAAMVCHDEYPRQDQDEILLQIAQGVYEISDGSYDKHIARLLQALAAKGNQDATKVLRAQ